MNRLFSMASLIFLLSVSCAFANGAQLTFSAGAGAMAGSLDVAVSKGFFTENGIDGKVVNYKNGKKVFDAYLAGKDDFAICSIIPIVLTDFNEEEHRIVGTLPILTMKPKCSLEKALASKPLLTSKARPLLL